MLFLILPCLAATFAALLMAIFYERLLQQIMAVTLQPRHVTPLLKQLKLEKIFEDKLQKIDWEEKIQAALQKRLESLLHVFKQEIPMSAMILTPTMSEKLNKLAAKELIKIVPDIKSMLASESPNIESQLSTSLQHIDHQLVLKALSPARGKACAAAALGGFLIGLLQALCLQLLRDCLQK